MKDCISCNSVLSESGYMQNALLWIPGIEDLKSLYIGKNGEAVRTALSNESIIESESLDIISSTSELFDFIIFDNSLDDEREKKLRIDQAMARLNEAGKIIIITQNKFGCRGLTSVNQDNSQESHLQLSWKEWSLLLKNCGQMIKTYFPYPDSFTADYLFSKDLKRSDLLHPDYNYSGPSYQIADSGKFMQSAFDAGYFEDFTNSYLFVISKANAPEIEYAKFSRNRKPGFQIYTTIENRASEKLVVKHPIYSDGKDHLQRMVDYQCYTNDYQSSNLKYCPAQMAGDSCIFSFIEGRSLDSELTTAVQNNDFDSVSHIMDIVWEAASFGPECKFTPNKEFRNLFGDHDYSLLEGEISREQSNIDLVPGNIIVGDDGSMTIIDYEWTFPFPVPTKFILFRSMLHSPEFNDMESEMKSRIWNQYGIADEMQDLFWKMEESFQQYVSDGTLWQKLAEAGGISVPIPDIRTQLIECTIEQDSRKVYKSFLLNPDLSIRANIESGATIHICFEHNAMMRIRKIEIDGKPVDFTTNADIAEGNEYIFTRQPIIRIENPVGSLLKLDVLIYSYDDSDITTVSNLMQTNHHLIISIDEIKGQYDELYSKTGVRLLRKLRLL
ncbi:hypothetical protein [Faecalibaculum rodentium]|nr:hypothetical protein [Faecalibaculum rodentium]